MRNFLFKTLLFIFAFGMIVQIIPNQSQEIEAEEPSLNYIFYSSYKNQSLIPSRLNNLSIDFFLPRYIDGIELTYQIQSNYIEIQDSLETIDLRTADAYQSIEVYRAKIVQEPSLWKQTVVFTIDITYELDQMTYHDTIDGQIVKTIPGDFLGGTIFTLIKYGQMFFEGALKTIILALVGTLAGFVLALILAVLKLQKPDKHDGKMIKLLKIFSYKFASLYITLFRGTPMIVQASFFWYGFALFGDPYYCGLFVVSLNTAAYIAEILRGGIQSIDKGQSEAAYALGMNQLQTMIYVIFPQAIKNSLPAIGNEFIVNIKDTAVLSVIGIFELFNQGRKITGMHYRQLEVYLIVALIYLFLTYTISQVLKKVEIKMNLQPLEITSSN